MYFLFSELRKWDKKTAETRRRDCAVLPLIQALAHSFFQFTAIFRMDCPPNPACISSFSPLACKYLTEICAVG